MKKCTWCGKDYPDEATACPLDGRPLKPVISTQRGNRPTTSPLRDASEPTTPDVTPQSIRFFCSSCKGGIEADKTDVGYKVRCPSCGSSVVVPDQTATPATRLVESKATKALAESARIVGFVIGQGRMRRRHYAICMILIACVCALVLALTESPAGQRFQMNSDANKSAQVLLLLCSWIPVQRRLHDLDETGWWFLILCLPCVGILINIKLLFEDGTKGDNKYGPDPKGRVPG